MPEEFKIKKGLELLGFNEIVDLETAGYILNEITNYIFDTSNQTVGEKLFDLEQDYKYYYYDFLRVGINLNKDISWWEFDTILEGIMLTENTAIGKVLGYRTYKPPTKNSKQYENEERKFYNEMKQKYALKSDKKINNGLEKLWNNLEQKVGETN